MGLICAVEFENSNAKTNILRAGVEYNIYDQFFIRGGVDQFNLTNTDCRLNLRWFFILSAVW